MVKHDKLVIGEPYEIVVREGGRIIKIRGNKLEQDDVDEMIASGYIRKDDVEEIKPKKFAYPKFDDFVNKINVKFSGWFGFFKKFYKTYPTVAFMLLLKEYSKFACEAMPLHKGDRVYLVNGTNLAVFETILPEDDFNLDILSFFPTAESANLAVNDIVKGLRQYDKP